jgi:hypothetical protein
MQTREIRCVNPACGSLNRVPRYSIRRIPECGKCRAKLPEPDSVRLLRRLHAIPRVTWIGIPSAAVIGWIIVDQATTSVQTKTPPARPTAHQAAPCRIGNPTTVDGIYRVYNSRERPRLTRWTINSGYGANYFVKLVDAVTDQPKVSYFVEGGSSIC